MALAEQMETIEDPWRPRAPTTLEDLGVPRTLVQDLVLRRALVDGRTSTLGLSSALAISPVVVTSLIEELRALRYLEVQGLDGRDYLVALTDLGRDQANERMKLSRYVGAVPVSLEAYTAMVERQRAFPQINRASIRRAFADLVVSDQLLDELGPAARSPGALFLYGPPGTGKSSIAERLNRIHGDAVLIPHAVEVDGQVITVFDPVVHQPIESQPTGLDPRWVLCRRPSIIVGGELTADMLDLQYEAGSGIYLAPLQMQANNGIFVIDDFGRQTLTPEQLLNRWIVPLDRSIDYLSLSYGVKFQIPFDAKIVFSTNLEPSSLGDEAFFRRIENKILVPSIDDAQFDEVLVRVTEAMGIAVEPGAPEYLRFVSREFGDGDLRPYLPQSVCRILRSICEYEEQPLVLSRSAIDRVARIYFTHADALRSQGTRADAAGAPQVDVLREEELINGEAVVAPPVVTAF
ncbi:MAG: hypothetical protein N2037_05305 [Acidimicrobiales bacterium]|nr:hypothetical protein [Acidimicrobiales bacterium]